MRIILGCTCNWGKRLIQAIASINRHYKPPLSRYLYNPSQLFPSHSTYFLDAEERYRFLSPSHPRARAWRVSRNCIARCEPRNCNCETAKLGGICTNSVHSDSLIRPSRATYNYSVSSEIPSLFALIRTHSRENLNLSATFPQLLCIPRRVNEIWE